MRKLTTATLVASSLLLLSSSSFAYSNYLDTNYPMDNGLYMGVSAGIAMYDGGKTDTISYVFQDMSQHTDQYRDSGKSNISGTVAAHFGYAIKNISHNNEISFGIGLYGNSGLVGEGQLWQSINGSTPDNYYNYKYSLQSLRIMAEVTAAHRFQYFFPFVTIGVGPSFMRSHNYRETFAHNPNPVDHAKPFADATNTSLAYHIGLGVGYYIDMQNSVAISYRHTNFGDVKFGDRDANGHKYSLDLGKITTNEILLNFTHTFQS